MKFKYDHSNCKWVNVDTIISIITLTYNVGPKLYDHARTDFASLNELVESRK
jgi:hypothetical protein